MRAPNTDHARVLLSGTAVILTALVYLASRDLTYVHIDAIAHVNKARGLFDSLTPGIRQLGTVWLPLPHLLMAPLTWFDRLWISGLAGSLVSAACFVGTGWFLFQIALRCTGSRMAAWAAFLFFTLNPRLVYLFTTPMTEPLTVFFASGLVYFLIRWIQTDSPRSLAMAALMAFAGTLTRYEGWALAAAASAMVFLVAREQRWVAGILFTGAACLGPLLWMLFNMAYFDDPLMFAYGGGSARAYAEDYLLRTGRTYETAGSWPASFYTYFTNVAYCLHPAIVWMALAGLSLSWLRIDRKSWRSKTVLLVMAATPFAFYVYNLYANMVPILMPGMFQDQADSMYNVRYGAVMAATIPVYAAFALYFVFYFAERERRIAFLLLSPLFLPDPVPEASREPMNEQFTANLFYREGVHNQSFWMPPFEQVAERLADEMAARGDDASLVMTNTRILHVVAWKTGIPMRRFIHDMNKDLWVRNLNQIDAEVRWVITESGDQLWHQHGKFLQENFVEVAALRGQSTGTVYLFRRPDPPSALYATRRDAPPVYSARDTSNPNTRP